MNAIYVNKEVSEVFYSKILWIFLNAIKSVLGKYPPENF